MSDITENIIGGRKLEEFWSELAKKLEKKDNIFQVADFDYTLFSRDEQFTGIPELLNNRADKGPAYLFENYGMIEFLEKYYKNHPLPKGIIEKFDPSRDIIMTAGGSKDFQIAKVRSCPELNDFRVVLTYDGKEKIPELIRYILFELRYIPSEIIVYEDRPQYFVEYRDFVEETLGTKLTVMKVEMDGNEGYKSIGEV
ncbi:hypothetical protein MK079_03745 [Candidatus Gracilibacteria bacterium]|nr:hypothetical protein [Candidatus Gracilibacteria bacterium]